MQETRHVWFHNESLAPGFSIIGIFWAIPVSWQGWVALALYVAAVVTTIALLFPQRWGLALLVLLALTVVFFIVSILKGKRVAGPGP